MDTLSSLEVFEDNWSTALGAWIQGQRVVFRGRDLFTEFANKPWMSVLMFGITGREFSESQHQFFESIWTLCTSYPDPRLWNNRVAALAGSSRSTAALATAAATAVSEASIYGRRPDIRAIDFLLRAEKSCDSIDDLQQYIQTELQLYGVILGYGRPIAAIDERIPPVLARAKELGLIDGQYFVLAQTIELILSEQHQGAPMNIAGLVASIMADQGLTAQEYCQFMTLSFSAGILPCYVDALQKPAGHFFPLRCSSVQYLGVSAREWNS